MDRRTAGSRMGILEGPRSPVSGERISGRGEREGESGERTGGERGTRGQREEEG